MLLSVYLENFLFLGINQCYTCEIVISSICLTKGNPVLYNIIIPHQHIFQITPPALIKYFSPNLFFTLSIAWYKFMVSSVSSNIFIW